MKRIIKMSAVFLLGIGILLFNRCSKDGATGPQGPQGPAGANGTANVTSTTYTMSSWSWAAPYYYRNLSVPQITDKNVDSVMVMVYFATTGSIWSALPYTQYHSPSDYYMGFNISTGAVQVTWVYDSSLSSGSDPNTYYATTIRCKVVIIPPGLAKAKVNFRNYEEVKAFYGLRD